MWGVVRFSIPCSAKASTYFIYNCYTIPFLFLIVYIELRQQKKIRSFSFSTWIVCIPRSPFSISTCSLKLHKICIFHIHTYTHTHTQMPQHLPITFTKQNANRNFSFNSPMDTSFLFCVLYIYKNGCVYIYGIYIYTIPNMESLNISVTFSALA